MSSLEKNRSPLLMAGYIPRKILSCGKTQQYRSQEINISKKTLFYIPLCTFTN